MSYNRDSVDCIHKHTTNQIPTKNLWGHIQIYTIENGGNIATK